MAQVKFYSVNSLPQSPNGGGVYFVDGGELYKGAQRFGANKVFTKGENQDLASFSSAGQIGGDILVGFGAAKVWDASANAGAGSWVDLGADVSSIIAQISDSTSTSTANGITVSVTTSDGYVTGVQVAAADISATSVTAGSGTFTNLTVSDTATFNATTVSASTLTVGGSDISDLISAGADARISAAKLSGNIAASDGTGLVNEGQVVTYVSAAIQSFDNAMHYIGTTSDANIEQDATAVPSDISGYTSEKRKSGDIVLKGTQEFIWNGSKWELIGDQGVYATKAELSASWSTLGTAAFVDTSTTVAADATTLPTGGAVASYVSSVIDGLAGSSSDSDKGIAVEVVTADG